MTALDTPDRIPLDVCMTLIVESSAMLWIPTLSYRTEDMECFFLQLLVKFPGSSPEHIPDYTISRLNTSALEAQDTAQILTLQHCRLPFACLCSLSVFTSEDSQIYIYMNDTYIYICIYTLIHIYMYIRIYVYMNGTHIHISTYVYIQIYIHIYSHTHVLNGHA